jgi:O-antigen/teichoic acid export membrane protein
MISITIFGVGLLYALIVSIFSYEILEFLFSIEYVEYEMIVWIMCVQYLFIMLYTMNSIALRVLDRPKKIFNSIVIETILTIIPGFLLIQAYGIEGAAEWKLLSSIIASMIIFYFYKKIKKELVSI